ncbi:hypothetical protein RU639_006670 [Aspergillus parasiticus]
MVKDGKLVGILDWEYAVTTLSEWKTLLRERLDAYGDAEEFWTYLCHLRQYPNIDGEGREILEKLPSD